MLGKTKPIFLSSTYKLVDLHASVYGKWGGGVNVVPEIWMLLLSKNVFHCFSISVIVERLLHVFAVHNDVLTWNAKNM